MNGNCKSINAPKVYKQICNGDATLEELAAEYGLSVENFCKVLERKIGTKNLEEIKKQGAKNKKIRQRQQERTTCLRNNNEQPCQPAPIGKSDLEKREELEKQLNEVQLRIDEQRALIRVDFSNCHEKEAEVSKAGEALRVSQKALETAQENLLKAQSKKKNHEEKFQKWMKAKKEILAQIEELNKKKIYLVAPNYRGEFPNDGTFISTVKIAGKNVTPESAAELMKEPTMSDILESGFENISDFNSALEFAKLVIKYLCEGDEISILVDDERTKAVLKQQYVQI